MVLAIFGHVKPIVSLVEFAGPEQVLETPELVKRAQPDRLAIGPKAHRAVERAVEDGESAFGVDAPRGRACPSGRW